MNSCAWLPAGNFSPVSGSSLTSNTATFSWCSDFPGATAFWLDVGKEQGENKYYQSGSLPITTFAQTVNSLPSNGSTIYVRLWYLVSGTWQFVDYTYTAFGGSPLKGQITSPAPNSTLTGSSGHIQLECGHRFFRIRNRRRQHSGWQQLFPVRQPRQRAHARRNRAAHQRQHSLRNAVLVGEWAQWLNNAYTYTAYEPMCR